MEKKQNKTKRFKLIDFEREGKGISKNQKDLEPGLKKFFLIYKDNFNKIVYLNILMILGSLPVLFLILNLAGYFQIEYSIPMSDVFQNIDGLFYADGGASPFKMMLYALEGRHNIELAPTTVTYVFYAIGALFLFTFGFVNVGSAYVLRNLCAGEPIFIWHDFFYAIKRNIKQALPFGIIDAIINILLIYNIYAMISNTDNFFASMLFWSNVVIFVVYFFMRPYIYIQMVTFKLSVFKILKNSLSFSLLGFKRNILAMLGNLLSIIIVLVLLLGTGGLLVPFAVAAPLAMLFSTMAYMKVYAAYFKIKEIMIDPYLAEHPEEKPTYDEEPIMIDDVTEKERIEEIKRKNGLT